MAIRYTHKHMQVFPMYNSCLLFKVGMWWNKNLFVKQHPTNDHLRLSAKTILQVVVYLWDVQWSTPKYVDQLIIFLLLDVPQMYCLLHLLFGRVVFFYLILFWFLLLLYMGSSQKRDLTTSSRQSVCSHRKEDICHLFFYCCLQHM